MQMMKTVEIRNVSAIQGKIPENNSYDVEESIKISIWRERITTDWRRNQTPQ